MTYRILVVAVTPASNRDACLGADRSAEGAPDSHAHRLDTRRGIRRNRTGCRAHVRRR
jgi:hypothetical protein